MKLGCARENSPYHALDQFFGQFYALTLSPDPRTMYKNYEGSLRGRGGFSKFMNFNLEDCYACLINNNCAICNIKQELQTTKKRT